MGFAERADDTSGPKCGVRNYVDVMLDRMPPDEAAHARRLLAGPKSNEQVAADFTAEGYPVKWGSVRNWRLNNLDGDA